MDVKTVQNRLSHSDASLTLIGMPMHYPRISSIERLLKRSRTDSFQRQEGERRAMSPTELSFRAARTGLTRSGYRELMDSARSAFAVAGSSRDRFIDAPESVRRSCEDTAACIVASPAMQRRIDDRAASICCAKGIRDLEVQHAVRASGEKQVLASVAAKVYEQSKSDPLAAMRQPRASPDPDEPRLPAGLESMLERHLRSQHAQEIAGGQGQRQRGMDARWSEGHEKKAHERGLK